MSDTDNGCSKGESAIYQRLLKLGHTAREMRRSGDHHNGHDSEYPLIGLCFDNAFVLCYLLKDSGYEPELVAGSTERVADELIQDGIDIEAVDSVTEYGWVVHYWVRVAVDDDAWHIDIASDSWDHLGECIVADGLPDGYVMFDDSLDEGRELLRDVIEEGQRCTYCGDHAYTKGGCGVCIETCAVC